jgi:hypothetical protein
VTGAQEHVDALVVHLAFRLDDAARKLDPVRAELAIVAARTACYSGVSGSR